MSAASEDPKAAAGESTSIGVSNTGSPDSALRSTVGTDVNDALALSKRERSDVISGRLVSLDYDDDIDTMRASSMARDDNAVPPPVERKPMTKRNAAMKLVCYVVFAFVVLGGIFIVVWSALGLSSSSKPQPLELPPLDPRSALRSDNLRVIEGGLISLSATGGAVAALSYSTGDHNDTYILLLVPTAPSEDGSDEIEVARFHRRTYDLHADVAGDSLSLSLSPDGNRVAFGFLTSIGTDEENHAVNKVRVMEKPSSEDGPWTQLGDDIVIESNSRCIGCSREEDGLVRRSKLSLALSKDGSRLAIGNPYQGGGSGRISVYDFDGAAWNQIQDRERHRNKFWRSGNNARFGDTTALSHDGRTLACTGETVNDMRIFALTPPPSEDPPEGDEDEEGLTEEDEDVEGLPQRSAVGVHLGKKIQSRSVRLWRVRKLLGTAARRRVFLRQKTGSGEGARRDGRVGPYAGVKGRGWRQRADGAQQRRQEITRESKGNLIKLRKSFHGRFRGSFPSLSLSAVGNRFAVCAGNVVKCQVYHLNSTKSLKWTQIGQSIEAKGRDEHDKQSVSLSADGKRLAVGSPATKLVRVYEMREDRNGKWEQMGRDYTSEKDVDFGLKVALNEDGSVLAVSYRNGVLFYDVRENDDKDDVESEKTSLDVL